MSGNIQLSSDEEEPEPEEPEANGEDQTSAPLENVGDAHEGEEEEEDDEFERRAIQRRKESQGSSSVLPSFLVPLPSCSANSANASVNLVAGPPNGFDAGRWRRGRHN
jgi:hypothetical protein